MKIFRGPHAFGGGIAQAVVNGLMDGAATAFPFLLAMILWLAVTCSAHAHDTDCNGKAQPAVVMSGCCGKEDYRALKPDEVRADGQGWDVFLDGRWREARHSDKMWLIAQPTLSACWGVWYRRGHMEGTQEYYTSHEGDTDDYAFYCLEQPATN